MSTDPIAVVRVLFAALAALFASFAVGFSPGLPSQADEADTVLSSPQVQQVPEPDSGVSTRLPIEAPTAGTSVAVPSGAASPTTVTPTTAVPTTSTPQVPARTTPVPAESKDEDEDEEEEPVEGDEDGEEGEEDADQNEDEGSAPDEEEETAPIEAPASEPAAGVPADDKAGRQQHCVDAGSGFAWDPGAGNGRGQCNRVSDPAAPIAPAPVDPLEQQDRADCENAPGPNTHVWDEVARNCIVGPPVGPADPGPTGPALPAPGDFPGKYRDQGQCEAAGYSWVMSPVPHGVPGANDLPFYHCVERAP